jgi:hypothetical protein
LVALEGAFVVVPVDYIDIDCFALMDQVVDYTDFVKEVLVGTVDCTDLAVADYIELDEEEKVPDADGYCILHLLVVEVAVASSQLVVAGRSQPAVEKIQWVQVGTDCLQEHMLAAVAAAAVQSRLPAVVLAAADSSRAVEQPREL